MLVGNNLNISGHSNRSTTVERCFLLCYFSEFCYRHRLPRLSVCPRVYLSQLGVIVVQLLLLIFYESSVFLFIGTCMLGLCISSVFPSLLAFTEDILNYRGKL